MSKLRELKDQILNEGVDLQIDEADWARIRALLPETGEPSRDDLRVLLDMRTEARVVCPAFDSYFFPAFKANLLADGKISTTEQFEILRMLYSGGGIDATERRFLQDLRRALREPSPEFEAMYKQAMRD
ncbi:MAG: hypothetical protein K8T89_22990 [Planctomycetes bacterium]|nr:hypothetical protein [Planctomycetota bacterium]